MADALRQAVERACAEDDAEVERLPEADQEIIGRQVLNHVEKLRMLRDDIDEGLRSLDAGKGEELDIDELISRARARHGKE